MDKIVQFSIPRSGSTLITQVLRKTFPNIEIQKVHSYRDDWPEYPVVVAVRDFRDCLVSQWRTDNDIPLDQISLCKMSKDDIDFWLEKIVQKISDLEQVVQSCDCLILQYEKFINNYAFIFSEIESFFNITISECKKQEIINYSNLSQNKKRSLKFNSFHEYSHEEDGIHGLHIYRNGTPGAWKELTCPEHHCIINDRLKDSLQKWNYEI